MLGEVMITPDVLRTGTHQNQEAADVYFQMLKEPLLNEVLVRNLRDGEWYQEAIRPDAGLSPRANELLRKLHRQNRLWEAPACGTEAPSSDLEWCEEALDSHRREAADCIVTTTGTRETHSGQTVLTDLKRVCSHGWWTSRSCSVRLERSTKEYLRHLDRTLCAANSVMFIDPHLDPSRPSYREFFRLLERCHRPRVPVRVELHRVCYTGSGAERLILKPGDLEQPFMKELKPRLANVNVKVEVFAWSDFHDRYLISDLIGISLPNGFDTSKDPNAPPTIWTRLSRGDRDSVQKEFDPDVRGDRLYHRFTLMP